MKKFGFEVFLLGLSVVVIIGLGFNLVLNPSEVKVDGKKVETYFAHITDAYELVDDPEFLVDGGVAPLGREILPRKVVTKRQASLEGADSHALSYIKEVVELDLKAKLTFTSEKGTSKVNEMTTGGEFEAGFIAGLVHYTRYRVQEGYTYPLLEDGSVGPKTYFIAKEPMEIWLDWKKQASYNPETTSVND